MDSLQEIYIQDLPTGSPVHEPGIPKFVYSCTLSYMLGLLNVESKPLLSGNLVRLGYSCSTLDFSQTPDLSSLFVDFHYRLADSRKRKSMRGGLYSPV